jgi:hypothetical protein
LKPEAHSLAAEIKYAKISRHADGLRACAGTGFIIPAKPLLPNS